MSSQAVATLQSKELRPSKIPSFLRFPLLVLLSLTSSALLYAFANEYTARDLVNVSKSLDQWWEVGALVGWRTFELGIGWFGDYDSYDLTSLSLLSHGPPLYLLSAFYDIQPSTVLSSLVIDLLATYIPFRLLRPLSRAHAASTFSPPANVPNSHIFTDLSVQAIATLLGGVIFSTTLFTSFHAFLRFYLVTNFSGIHSITATYSTSPLSFIPMTIFFGLASKSFIFTPAAAASATKPVLDPVNATLWETLVYNIWGYSPRTKAVIKRTAALVLISGVNTFVQTFVTIAGVEATGAIAYSSVWSVASGLTGLALGIVGDV